MILNMNSQVRPRTELTSGSVAADALPRERKTHRLPLDLHTVESNDKKINIQYRSSEKKIVLSLASCKNSPEIRSEFNLQSIPRKILLSDEHENYIHLGCARTAH